MKHWDGWMGIALVAAGLGAAGTPARAVGAAAAPVVEIQEFRFSSGTVTVPVGTTVTWVNHDEEPHTVTSAERVFASPALDAGESFAYRFTTPGVYAYYCALHPHMTGRIVVR